MSDQDFFFDEDEKPAEKTSTSDKGSAPSAKKAAPAKGGASAQPIGMQQVSMTVTALVAVIALLVGVIGGYMLRGAAVPTSAPTSTGTSVPGTPDAPQLSPEQLEGGQLPEGHPNIGGGEGGAGGSTEPTSK